MLAEPPAPILLDYDAVATAGRTYVAENAGEVLGMVTTEQDDPYLILRNLAVRPSCQRRGVGRRLVHLVEDMAVARGLRGVRLWTRAEMHDNIAFYRSLAYTITHSERTAEAHRVFLLKQWSDDQRHSAVT